MLTLFDLDHTLVHSTLSPVEGFDAFAVRAGGRIYTVHVRPYAVDMLSYLLQRGVPCGVWTAASHEYMTAVLDGLFARVGGDWRERLHVAYSREHTTRVDAHFYAKDLRLVGGPSDVVLYDDDRRHALWGANRGRVRLVPPFDALAAHDDAFFLRELFALERGRRRDDAAAPQRVSAPPKGQPQRPRCLHKQHVDQVVRERVGMAR